MNQLSSGIVSSGSNIGTNSLVPLLSLPPPSPFSSSSASLSFSRFIKGKTLVLDYWAVNKNCYKRRRGQHVIQASSEFASQSIWDDWKPPKASSTPSFSEILWPSAGSSISELHSISEFQWKTSYINIVNTFFFNIFCVKF